MAQTPPADLQRNLIERAVILGNGDQIDPATLYRRKKKLWAQ
jgi:hypothetical protein